MIAHLRFSLPATLLVILLLAPAAAAATPFTAGTGTAHDLAVGDDGTGHVVWMTNETSDRVGYCRVPPGGGGCDSESTFLTFPMTTTASSVGDHPQVFTPSPNKVVILASCNACGTGGDRTYRFISTNNGVDFSAAVLVGGLELNGQSAFLDNAGDVALGVSGRLIQGLDDLPGAELARGSTPSSVYNASAMPAYGTVSTVYAVNDLDTVEYRIFTDSSPGTSAAEISNDANWGSTQFLTDAEGNNDETMLGSGPSGTFLSYRYGAVGDTRVGLRRFDGGSLVFGGPTYIEGDDQIENSGISEVFHSQDPAGRLHAIWRTLYEDHRLRYRRSDDGGATFTAAGNLASGETFLSPMVAAGPDGRGFAIWRGNAAAIRVVVIDPQPEPTGDPGPGGPGGPDTTRPSGSGFRVGDSTLAPGQSSSFSFNSTEAGTAVLTVQKQIKGLKLRSRGRTRCLPQTRRRLRALRRAAPNRAAYRRALRRRRCTAYKRIGSIRQAVVPGRNVIRFSGRIAGRRLRPGRYRALLVITDAAGNVSRTEQVRFRVLPRR